MYYPLPVTGENYPEVWTCVDRLRIRARRRKVQCAAAAVAAGFICLPLSVLLFCALAWEAGFSPMRHCLELVPWLQAAVDFVRRASASFGPTLLTRALIGVLSIQLAALLAGTLAALLVWVVYHPFARKLPEGTPKENGSGLLANARETLELSFRIRPVGFWIFLFGFFFAEFGLLGGCALTAGSPEAASGILSSFLTRSAPLNYLILFAAGTSLFAILYGIPVLILRIFFRLRLGYGFVADIECYSLYSGEKAGKLSPAELAAKRKTAAAEKCRQALELEKTGSYRKASLLLLEAAHGGDVSAMEHYGRHCIISGRRLPARYWLERCVSTGEASKNAQWMLRRLKLGLTSGIGFIRE